MWRWLLHPLWLNIVLMPTEQAQTTSLLLSSVTIGLSIHPINWTILCQTVVACSVRIQQNRTKWCKPCHTVLIILIVWYKCFHTGYFSVSNNRQCFTDNPSKHQVTISDIWRHRCQVRFISMYLCSRIQTFNTRIDESLYKMTLISGLARLTIRSTKKPPLIPFSIRNRLMLTWKVAVRSEHFIEDTRIR